MSILEWNPKGVIVTPLICHCLTSTVSKKDTIACLSGDPNATPLQFSNDTFNFFSVRPTLVNYLTDILLSTVDSKHKFLTYVLRFGLIWLLEPQKPFFNSHFGRKRYPLFRDFSWNICQMLFNFGEHPKILPWIQKPPMFRDFLYKIHPCLSH